MEKSRLFDGHMRRNCSLRTPGPKTDGDKEPLLTCPAANDCGPSLAVLLNLLSQPAATMHLYVELVYALLVLLICKSK